MSRMIPAAILATMLAGLAWATAVPEPTQQSDADRARDAEIERALKAPDPDCLLCGDNCGGKHGNVVDCDDPDAIPRDDATGVAIMDAIRSNIQKLESKTPANGESK
jgi:hypothetical protein